MRNLDAISMQNSISLSGFIFYFSVIFHKHRFKCFISCITHLLFGFIGFCTASFVPISSFTFTETIICNIHSCEFHSIFIHPYGFECFAIVSIFTASTPLSVSMHPLFCQHITCVTSICFISVSFAFFSNSINIIPSFCTQGQHLVHLPFLIDPTLIN